MTQAFLFVLQVFITLKPKLIQFQHKMIYLCDALVSTLAYRTGKRYKREGKDLD